MSATSLFAALSVDNAARYIGIGRTTLYRMIEAGNLPARKIERRTVILRSDLDHFLNTLPERRGADR